MNKKNPKFLPAAEDAKEFLHSDEMNEWDSVFDPYGQTNKLKIKYETNR